MLAASREEILKESRWNVWIRDLIADAFVQTALPLFLDDMNTRYKWFLYLPRPGEVHEPFFDDVVSVLYARLAEELCIPSVDDAMCPPSQVIIPGAE